MSESPIGINAPSPFPGCSFLRERVVKVVAVAGWGIGTVRTTCPAAGIVTTVAADARATLRTGCTRSAEG